MEYIKNEGFDEAIDKGLPFMLAGSRISSPKGLESVLPKLGPVQGRTTGPTRRSVKGGWTREEDELLTTAVRQYNAKNWKKIAESFPGRSDVQCLHRWQKVLNPDLVKGPWTKEEDDRIIELVEKFGCKKWSVIAQYLPGRIGKQCRERWHNHLNPAIKKDAWTKDEELALIRAHTIYGNKWAEIARFLPGRADNSIKNHWNCSVKKYLLNGELSGTNAFGLGNNERKQESPKVEVSNQSIPVVVNQKSNDQVGTLGELCLENSNEGLMDLTVGTTHAQYSRSLQEEAKFLTRAPITFQLNGKRASRCDPVAKYHRGDTKNVCAPYDLHSSIVEPEISHPISSGDSIDFMLSRDSGCLKFPLDTRFSPDLAHSLTTKRLPESPKRPRHYASPINDSGGLSRFNSEHNKPFSRSLTYGFGTENSKVCGDNKISSTPPHSKEMSLGPMWSEPLQWKNENASVINVRLATDNCSYLANSPVCSTPPSHMQSFSATCTSPTSILRSRANTYKNTPSIIRKRRYKTFTQAHEANDSKDLCTPEARSTSSNDMESSAHSCHRVLSGQDDLGSINLKAKPCCLSTPSCLQPESITSGRSIEKRLEYVFDMEWDKPKGKSNTLATGNDSSDDNRDL